MPELALLRVRPRRRRSALVATLHDALTVAPEIAVNTSSTTTKSIRRTRTERPSPPGERPTNPNHPPSSSPTAKSPLPSSSSSAAAYFSPTRQREEVMKVTMTPSMIDEPMDYVVTATCRTLMPLPTVNDERNDKKQTPRLISKRRSTRNLKGAAYTTTTIHKVAVQSKRKFNRSSGVKANSSNVRMFVDTVMATTKTTSIASTAAAHINIVTDDSSWSDTNHNHHHDRAVTTTKLFPTRKRIPTNFYHATVSTAIMTKHKNRVSRTNIHCHRSNNNNDMNQNKYTNTTLPTTLRPQRKRIPTDFYAPSRPSAFLHIRSNPARPVLPPQESIPIRSVTATMTSVPPPTPKRPKRTEPEEPRDDTSRTRDNASLPMVHVPEPTGVVVRSHRYDDGVPAHGGNLSYSVLLADYQERVTLGHCHPISFGKTLSSALLAIDRKIQSLKSQKQYQLDCQNSDNDKEIVADLREYKRSLRAFSVYEDREKLASIQEVQESLECWGRYYATTTVPSKRYQRCDPSSDHHGNSSNRPNDCRMELSLLEKRPIVISSIVRMMSRNAFKCSNGTDCIFGCHRKTMTDTKVWTANAVMAPVPLIQPFRIDDNEMDDHSSTVTKTKRTIDTLRELQSSLQFVATYQDTTEKFASLE